MGGVFCVGDGCIGIGERWCVCMLDELKSAVLYLAWAVEWNCFNGYMFICCEDDILGGWIEGEVRGDGSKTR